jgi:hypothetical protein
MCSSKFGAFTETCLSAISQMQQATGHSGENEMMLSIEGKFKGV